MIPVFVISLKRATERRAIMQAHLDALGIPFAFFDAVDGDQITPEQMALYRPRRRGGWRLIPGEVGNVASFYYCFQQIAKGPDEFVCVLEDDVELSPDIHPFLQEQTLRTLGPFDLLKLHDRGGRQIPVTQVGDTRVCAPWRAGGGGFGQICTRDAAARIVLNLLPFRNCIDMMLFYHAEIPGLRILATHPRLVTHRPGPSMIDPAGRRPRRKRAQKSLRDILVYHLVQWGHWIRALRRFVRVWGVRGLMRLEG